MLVRIALGRCSLSYFYLASFLHCIVFFTPLSIRFISPYLVFPFLRVLAFPRLLPVAIKDLHPTFWVIIYSPCIALCWGQFFLSFTCYFWPGSFYMLCLAVVQNFYGYED